MQLTTIIDIDEKGMKISLRHDCNEAIVYEAHRWETDPKNQVTLIEVCKSCNNHYETIFEKQGSLWVEKSKMYRPRIIDDCSPVYEAFETLLKTSETIN